MTSPSAPLTKEQLDDARRHHAEHVERQNSGGAALTWTEIEHGALLSHIDSLAAQSLKESEGETDGSVPNHILRNMANCHSNSEVRSVAGELLDSRLRPRVSGVEQSLEAGEEQPSWIAHGNLVEAFKRGYQTEGGKDPLEVQQLAYDCADKIIAEWKLQICRCGGVIRQQLMGTLICGSCGRAP